MEWGNSDNPVYFKPDFLSYGSMPTFIIMFQQDAGNCFTHSKLAWKGKKNLKIACTSIALKLSWALLLLFSLIIKLFQTRCQRSGAPSQGTVVQYSLLLVTYQDNSVFIYPLRVSDGQINSMNKTMLAVGHKFLRVCFKTLQSENIHVGIWVVHSSVLLKIRYKM